MSYTHKVIEFYGDPINFFINKENVLIGMKSVSNSLGIPWSTQRRRLKNFYPKCATFGSLPNRAICLPRPKVKQYLSFLDENKACNPEKIKLYQNEFPQFSYDQTTFGNQVEIEDFYLGSIEGIKQLIYDAVIKLGNEKAIEQLALILFPLLTEPIISNDHIEILGPAYDLAEKTADRQNELIKHKSTSISKQLEIIAETIRDSDRKSSLELRRIAKSVY